MRELISIDRDRYIIKFFTGVYRYELMCKGGEENGVFTNEKYVFKTLSCLERVQNFKRFSYLGKGHQEMFLGVRQGANNMAQVCLVDVVRNECLKVFEMKGDSCMHNLIVFKDVKSYNAIKVVTVIKEMVAVSSSENPGQQKNVEEKSRMYCISIP